MFRKNYYSSSVEFLEKHNQVMLRECLNHSQKLGRIAQNYEGNWQKQIMEEAFYIIGINKGREALDNAISEIKKNKIKTPPKSTGFCYQVSSLFLSDCYQYLKEDPRRNERIHLVTGTITADGTKVLSRMEKLKYGQQSPVYVAADKTDSHQKIIRLAENFGHHVLAVFHSHTSKGASSTMPSAIDNNFLQRMAKIGCHCLGGIFSLDGYVRFFKESERFDIDVYGKGTEKIADHFHHKIFKISESKNDAAQNI
jgi:proteasome lid subunit RPN8/RPN11